MSCSTEKNTLTTRSFHNLTAHYNVYFNGNESLESGLQKVDNQIDDDFTKILPIYKTNISRTANIVSSDMDYAIEKAGKLIKVHSITKPPKRRRGRRRRREIKPEYNKWVDDAYILMGRAQLYKDDFIQAAGTFSYLIRKFKDEPVKHEAYVWLIRTYTESERYTEAQELVESLQGDDLFPEDLFGELAIAAANLQLVQEKYNEAIHYLNIGIDNIKGNSRKTRYTYILAQLYQETGRDNQALEAYHNVIRRRPDYKMLFNARINSAEVFSGEGNMNDLRKELNKMKRKKRNEEYLDQIYFALGNIHYNADDVDKALELYEESAAVSDENQYQRTLSCLTVAEIYFDRKKYILSQNYYDSAMVIMDQEYPNYEVIADRYQSLSNLVGNLVEVDTQDSLQNLASLPTEELNAKIDEWIEEEKERIEKEEEMLATGGGASGYYRSSRMRLGGGVTGWYFYNPSTVSFGKKEFQRLWGERKLEDNWRRSNKGMAGMDDFEDGEGPASLAEEMEEEGETKITDATTREYYLQHIPNNDSLLAASHHKIKESLYNAGRIFKEDFNDLDRSIECFKDLNNRYPENTYQLASWYNLYDNYKTREQQDSSLIYKTAIIENYPESSYAKYLVNPNYFIELELKKDSINKLYQQAFEAYNERDFRGAFQLTNRAMTLSPDSALIPKIRFIQMVSTSRSLDAPVFADSLQKYIDTYPKAETASLAKDIKDLLGEDKLEDYDKLVKSGYLNDVIKNPELLAETEASEDEFGGKWEYEEELLHYFVIAVPNKDNINVNRLKFDIANYNLDHYTMRDFDIETENLNSQTKLIVVRSLANKDNALVYFLSIIRKPDVFKALAGNEFINFTISNLNYRQMVNDQSYEDYIEFFVKQYSRFVKNEINEEDLKTPEELMARLNKEEEEDFEEKGEFVVVEADTAGIEIKKPDTKFKLEYNEPHKYAIFTPDPSFRMGYLMRGVSIYNRNNHRDKRYRISLDRLGREGQFLFVQPFDSAYKAMDYLNELKGKDEVLSSLDDVEYQRFIISDANIDSLKKNKNIDEYQSFYKLYYETRKPPRPFKKVVVPEEKEDDQSPDIEQSDEADDRMNDQQDSLIDSETEVKENTESSIDNTRADTISEVEITEELTEQADSIAVVESADSTVNEVVGVQDADGDEQSVFKLENDSVHQFIYLIPKQGFNKAILITALNKLNVVKFRQLQLSVNTKNYDEYSELMVVQQFENKKQCENYLKILMDDKRTVMATRGIDFKRFAISKNNLSILLDKQNMNEYLRFYKKNYAQN